MKKQNKPIISRLKSLPRYKNNAASSVNVKRSKTRICSYRFFGVITILIILIFILFKMVGSSTESFKSLVSASEFKITQIKESRNLKNLSKTDTVDISEQIYTQSELVVRIGKHVILPSEDISMMVKVKNAESLKSQGDIYAELKDGDYILLYPHLAIIYDASADRILKYIPLR